MTSKAPLVSIGMPVRNGEEYLSEALDSLLGQTFTDFELILSDNGSEDATPEICKAYAARDSRVHYHRFEQDVGAARNYNHTFNRARGRYFKWAAHDDVCLPEFLSRCLSVFNTAPASVVLVYARTELIGARREPLGYDPVCLGMEDPRAHRRLAHYLEHVRFANAVMGLIRSDVLRKTRVHDTFISADLVLMGELQMLGAFREVPEVLFRRRLHVGQSRQANVDRRDLQAWFDPTTRNRMLWVPVDVLLTLEYARSAMRIPTRLRDRLLCLMTVMRKRLWKENIHPRLRRFTGKPPPSGAPRHETDAAHPADRSNRHDGEAAGQRTLN